MARAGGGRRIDVQEVLAEAARLHGEGELTEAERLYRRVLALDPDQVEALHLLGAIAAGTGRLDYAVELIAQAIAVAGESPAFHYTLARAFEAAGRVGEALLAQADGLRVEGRLTEAADRYWQALGADADLVGAFVGLGTVLLDQGDGEGAEAMFREALTRRSGDAAAELGLGRTLARRGHDDQAIAHFERALTLDPRCAEAASALGRLYHRLGDFEVAAGWFERAVELRPAAAENRLCYAQLLADRGRPGAGVVQVAKALARRPGWLEALLLQGALLREQGRAAEAALSFARALECDPGCEAARSGLIHLGQLDAALADAPDFPPPLAVAAEWSGRRDPERRLRVGYVSPEFRRGALAPFLETLLAHHDPAQVEAVCYAEVPRPDMVTSRFQALAAGWRFTVGVATAALAEWVRADGIDILVDLAGHGPGNRLALFAYHPAPLQVSGLGWPASAGLGLFDGRLTDSLLDPPGETSAGGETSLRLPQGFACWRPPAGAPAATAPPTGAPTFGSFNTLAKLSPATVSLWAELLRR
ncbi:MAG: tetratricopeptide repeat protein, partial [Rhodospirillaceae bacterium]